VIIALLIAVCLLGLLALIAINLYMVNYSRQYILDDDSVKDLEAEYIVVLGAKVYKDGRLSLILDDRVKASVKLFEEGRVPAIIMSGDAQREDYNEVDPMKKRAIELGVPEECIITDTMGLSTFESMKRLKDEFGVDKVIICTQEYHMYRAIYNARKMGIEAYGYPAEKIDYANQLQRDVREVLARVKDFILVLFTT
jgi:SanA protein